MAKISPVSIKYLVHANFVAEGRLEKPDVIGAIFGQTEGLLGSDLEMRELQKEGKIGRIDVDVKYEDSKTLGKKYLARGARLMVPVLLIHFPQRFPGLLGCLFFQRPVGFLSPVATKPEDRHYLQVLRSGI